MKTNFTRAIICLFTFLFLFRTSNSQVSVLPNVDLSIAGPTDYVGWSNLMGATSLKIKTEANANINFYTNAGAGAFGSQRMTILGANGFVGIGVANPGSILEVRRAVAGAPQMCLSWDANNITHFRVSAAGNQLPQRSSIGELTNQF